MSEQRNSSRRNTRDGTSDTEGVPEVRSAQMSRIRRVGLMPELEVRYMLKIVRHRIRSEARDLAGSLDIVARSERNVELVHEGFWSRRLGFASASIPGANFEFWSTKFDASVARDRCDVRQLRRLGYSVITIRECKVKLPSKLTRNFPRLQRFLDEV